ncbi:hypothetical protein ABFU14_05580 [Xanthomonas campestris pv. raphani]|uniref:hypothetical protein n=1 Tax=Xanthomonas campestris TaxID=339 RepID=UPI00388E4692
MQQYSFATVIDLHSDQSCSLGNRHHRHADVGAQVGFGHGFGVVEVEVVQWCVAQCVAAAG